MTELEQKVLYLHSKGLIDVVIAKEISKSPDTVAYYRKKHNLTSNFVKDYNVKDILKALKTEETIYKISKRFKCSSTFLINLCNKNNIKKQTFKEYIDSIQIVKINPFKDLTCKNTNYWLGMLAADGSIHDTKIALTLQELDIKHIIKYRNFVNINLNIYKNIKDNKHISYGTAFRNKEVVLFLHNIGLTNKKSFTLNYKPKITIDFLRGVIDGDGYIRKNGCEVSITTGSEIFANQLQKFIITNIKVNCTIRKVKNIFTVGVYGKLQVKELLKIYKNADTYLNRKYDNAMLLRNK